MTRDDLKHVFSLPEGEAWGEVCIRDFIETEAFRSFNDLIQADILSSDDDDVVMHIFPEERQWLMETIGSFWIFGEGLSPYMDYDGLDGIDIGTDSDLDAVAIQLRWPDAVKLPR